MNSKFQKLFNKANSYFKAGDFDSAVACYEVILQDTDDKFVRGLAYWGAGECYLDVGEFKKAENYLRIAIGLNRKEPNYHHLLGVTLNKLNRFGEAIAEFKIALKFLPYHSELLRQIGWAYFMRDQIDAGRIYLEKSLKKDITRRGKLSIFHIKFIGNTSDIKIMEGAGFAFFDKGEIDKINLIPTCRKAVYIALKQLNI